MKGKKSILERFTKDLYLEKVFPVIREKKTQRFIALACTLFAISFFGFFAISPTLSTIADLQKQLADNKFADQQLQTKITNLSTLEQKYNDLQNDLPAVFAAIPQSPQIPLLVGQLYAIAQKNNLTVTKISTESISLVPLNQPIAVGKNKNIQFTITLLGSKDALLSTMHKIAHFERIITIDSLSLEKNDNSVGAETGLISLTIKGQAYFKQ